MRMLRWVFLAGLICSAASVAAARDPQNPTLVATPDTLFFDAIVGGPNPDSQSVTVTIQQSAGDVGFAVSHNSWITVRPLQGVTPSNIFVLPDMSGLQLPGEYQGTFYVDESPLTGSVLGDSVIVLVTLHQIEIPHIVASADTLQFTFSGGPNDTLCKSIQLSMSDGSAVAWCYYNFVDSTIGTFVSESPGGGTLPTNVSVCVIPSGWGPGTYYDTLLFCPWSCDAGNPKDSRIIQCAGVFVRLNVVCPPCGVRPGWPYFADYYSQNAKAFGVPLQVGDIIEAKDPDGVCCGTAVVGELTGNPGDYLIHVLGDKPSTPEDEGAVEGDSIVLLLNCSCPVFVPDTWSNQASYQYNVDFCCGTCGQPPTAVIDNITPSPAKPGQTVAFAGHGNDPNGSIVAYNWRSSIDGQLSTQATFSTSSLLPGVDTIYFKVQDDDLQWSTEVAQELWVQRPHYYFLHLTDIHIGTKGAVERFGDAVALINGFSAPPAFVVISGDLAGASGTAHEPGATPEFDHLFDSIANMLQVPWYSCPGNHDLYDASGYPCLTSKRQLYLDSIQYHMDSLTSVDDDMDYVVSPPGTNLRLISMNSGCNTGNPLCWFGLEAPEGTGLTPSQYGQLSSWLSAPTPLPTIVFMHHPLVWCSGVSSCGEEPCGDQSITQNRHQTWALLKDPNGDGILGDAVKLILSGHTHERGEYRSDSYSTATKLGKDLLALDTYGYGGMLPLHATTQDLVFNNYFRRIDVTGDRITVYRPQQFQPVTRFRANWNPKNIAARMSAVGPGDTVGPAGRLHVYTSTGSHIGVGQMGSLDFEIPGSTYGENGYFDNTTDQLLITGEEVSIPIESETYSILLKAIDSAQLTLEIDFPLADGSMSQLTYSAIETGQTGQGELNIVADSIEPLIHWDDDGDGTIDREIPPDCYCPCLADPQCDKVTNVLDVVAEINVAFRALPAVVDVNCSKERSDVDCSGSTDVLDVVRVVNVAFRGMDPATQFCSPCQ